MWSLPDPVKPSDFRRAAKERSANNAATAPPTASPATAPGRVVLPVPPTSGMSSGAAEESGGGGDTVNVKGYTRKDGTVVKPHTRSKPND